MTRQSSASWLYGDATATHRWWQAFLGALQATLWSSMLAGSLPPLLPMKGHPAAGSRQGECLAFAKWGCPEAWWERSFL